MASVCNKVRGKNEAQATAEAPTPSQSDIERLVEKAAGGDFKAFGELYSIYLDRIYRFVFYQINDKMAAEDITEEVFVKAWKAISSCKGKSKTFTSWLYRIARNHMINSLRSMRKHTSIEKANLVEGGNPELEVEMELEYQELCGVINCLPQNQRQVIILKLIEGLDNQEIAKTMGKSQGAVRVLQMRALAALRQKLG